MAKVIEELKLIWSNLKIVHRKACHPQSQGSVEKANGDCKIQFQLWMEDNQSTKWSLGLKFVQMTENNSNHRTIQCTPYFAKFGKDMPNGLSSTIFPKEILEKLSSEEDLQQDLIQRNVK